MDNFIDEFNKFNASKPYVPASPDEVYDYEDWEIEYELIEHEDWNGLILYRQSVLRRHPDSLQAKSESLNFPVFVAGRNGQDTSRNPPF
jgi:hypothetical protein